MTKRRDLVGAVPTVALICACMTKEDVIWWEPFSSGAGLCYVQFLMNLSLPSGGSTLPNEGAGGSRWEPTRESAYI